MIAFMKGKLIHVAEDHFILENQGIGYEIKSPLSVLRQLPLLGEEIRIYTYLYLREDLLQLYGFLSQDDLLVFKLLITVNGIGPKGALGILSVISPDDLRFYVLANDVKAISKAPGIGAKTAGKLILELKDKLKLSDGIQEERRDDASLDETGSDWNTVRRDAVQALVSLGYSNTEALKAVRQVEIAGDMTVESVLKLSLKQIGRFT